MFIVPAAHTRIFDGEFQGEMYEAFHTVKISRWGHALCTPLINIALFSLAGAFNAVVESQGTTFTISGSLVAALLAQGFYLIIYGWWSLLLAPLLLAAGIFAMWLHEFLGANSIPGALLVVIAATYVQTFSHLWEPIPPPWSGGYRFGSFRKLVSRTPSSRLALLAALSLTVFPILELWAALRIWPLQVAQGLGSLGLLQDRTRRLRERVREIQRDTRRGWPHPPSKIDH